MRRLLPIATIAVLVLAVTYLDYVQQVEALKDSSAAALAAIAMLTRASMLGGGALLIWYSIPRLRSRGVFCRKCGYQRDEVGRITGECPECGWPWRWIGNFRIGHRRGTRWMLLVGILPFLMVLTPWTLRRTAPSVLLSLTPDDALLATLSARPDFELAEEWHEFNRRVIPKQKLDALARSLERKQRRDRIISASARDVIFAAALRDASNHVAPASAIAYSHLLTGSINAPESSFENEAVEVKLALSVSAGEVSQSPGTQVYIYAALIAQGKRHIQKWPLNDFLSNPTRETRFTLTDLAPGDAKLRLEIHLAPMSSPPSTEPAVQPWPPPMSIGSFESVRTLTIKPHR